MFHSGQRKDLERIVRINKAVLEGRGYPGQRYIHLINIYPRTNVNIMEFDPKKAEQHIAEGYERALQKLSRMA